MRQKWIFIFLVFVALGLSACETITLPIEAASKKAITLEACHLSTPGSSRRISAQCGMLRVFEDPNAQSGREIELNLAVIPAISRNPAPDPLFFLAGGPGEAATESFLIVYAALNRINQKRDIVLVDQRGTGGSNPLFCPDMDKNTEGFPDNEATEKYLQNCIANLHADPRLYTTSIAMDDLDKIRDALGYDQINLYGASYGTRAALVYARQHGENLRSMILDGVVPLNWTLGPSIAGDAQRALELIFDRCKNDPVCRMTFPDLTEEFQAIVNRLQLDPFDITLMDPISGVEIGQEVTLEIFTNTIHSMSYTPETAALIPYMIHEAYQYDNFQPLAAQYLTTTILLEDQISAGMRFSVLCSEDFPFYSTEPSSQGYLEGQFQESFELVCKNWPSGNLPEYFKEPVETDTPTLLLSGEADPVTPPANGELARKTLPNSLHIIAPGQGHIVIFRGCIPQIGSEFIQAASVDHLDISCVQEIKPMPFFINANGPTP